jgi:outer membrane protein
MFFSAISMAADTGFRVAYVDLQKALQTVDAGKKAKSSLEKEVAAKRASLEKKQADLQKEAEAFEKKAAIMNDQTKAQKQAELQKRFAEFQKEAAESQMELQKSIGKEKGYQLIVEKNEGAVLYAEAGADLTDQVISKFNAKKKK